MGETKLWYSQEGKDKFRSNSLYLAKGDFRTEQGSIYAAKEIHVGRYLEVQAWPGHGSGNAQLWHGRKEKDASRHRKVLSLHTKTCLLDVMSRLEHPQALAQDLLNCGTVVPAEVHLLQRHSS